MAVYVMSDLHGNYEGFMSVLEQIHFLEADELYVNGDIVDRGRGGIKILQYMMMQPNIYPIIGNHEYALMQVLDFVTQEITEDAISNINEKTLQNIIEYQNIGGQITLDEFHKLSKEEQRDIMEYLDEFATYEEITVNEKKFIIIHAGFINFRPERKMDDYRRTKYCIPLEGIEERKKEVKQSVLQDHPRAKDMHTYVSDNSTKYKHEFMQAYHFKCAYCGVSIDLIPKATFEIDHFVNQKSERFTSKKDAGTIDNLVLACRDCNHSKNAFEVTEENEDDLNPDKDNIVANFSRDDMFYIVPSESGKTKPSITGFYEKLHLGSEIHRIDYLVMSMIGLQKALKDKGTEYAELSNAINILKSKRNLMSV